MRRLTVLLTAVAALIGARAVAAEGAARSLTIDEAVAAALASNVDIAAQRLADRGSVLDLGLARAVYEPYLASYVRHRDAHEAPSDAIDPVSAAADVASTSNLW